MRSRMSIIALITFLILVCILSPVSDIPYLNADTNAESIVYTRNIQISPANIGYTSDVDIVHIEDQLLSIAGKYTAVWGYDGSEQRWIAYFPSEPAFANDLIRLEIGQGYWIKTTQDCTLIYNGRQYMLHEGWNTIGWLGGAPVKIIRSTADVTSHETSVTTKRLPIEDQLKSIAGKFTAVWSFDGSQQRWIAYFPSEPVFANDLIEMEVGKAYWIKATQNCTLTYGGRQFSLYKGLNIIVWFGGKPASQTGAAFKSGGCFIATAAYGTPLAQEINILRQFRDEYLLSNPAGRVLVSLYYRSSPPFARLIENVPVLKPLVRVGLLPALYLSKFAVGITSTGKMAVFGGFALVFIVLLVWFRKQTSVAIRS